MNSKPKANTVLLAYIPVLHDGYQRFISSHLDVADTLYLLGVDFTHQLRPLVKDIRALEPSLIAQALLEWYPDLNVQILNSESVKKLQETHIIAPDEDISRKVITDHFPFNVVTFNTVFLRWDHEKSLAAQPLQDIPTLSPDELQKDFLERAQSEALKSSDWWRHVGAILVSADGQTVLSDHNHHLPSEYAPYVAGDPRANFHKGEHIELTTAIHAEAAVIGTAARQGISTEGAQLYVTTFPCPVCAKLVVQAGIKKVYFSEGYAVLDGLDVLKSAEIEIKKLTSDSSQP